MVFQLDSEEAPRAWVANPAFPAFRTSTDENVLILPGTRIVSELL
jgi:hypothetical protein